MATYRIGIGSFNLKDGAVGIGTESSGLGNLKVEGTYKTTDLDVIGVSTFQRYAGFAADELNIVRDTSLSSEHSTIGDIVVGLNSTFTVSAAATVTVGTVESVSIGTHFSPPTGGVEERPEVPVEGTVRFNKDLNTLEFYNGVDWRQFTVNNSGASGRAVYAGGRTPSSPYTSKIEYAEIASTGNTQSFGDLVTATNNCGGCSSSTRGLIGGGNDANYINVIQSVTIASRGNSANFGDLTPANASYVSGGGSSTRGIFSGGYQYPSPAYLNTIDYVEIATIGNAVDFGDLVVRTYGAGACANSTRYLHIGGHSPSLANEPQISYITIASKGNSLDFGNLTVGRKDTTACSNSTRGVVGGGENPSTYYNVIDYVTIASTGDAVDFGNLTVVRDTSNGAASQVRGIFFGGRSGTSPNPELDVIDYVTITSAGNATDFGELSLPTRSAASFSDCHGGLGGI